MSLNRYFFALQEKLKASDSMSDWISDFKKSDAPQFTGKSEEKRRQMAIAAKLGAERGQQNEEKYSDSGWKEPQTAAKTKNVAQNLARKAMNRAVQTVKDEKGFGPSPADKLSIRKNEEVELDEASTAERKERNAAINNMHKGFYDKASKSKLKKVSKIGSDTYFIKSRSIYDPHESHFKTASGKYGSTMHSSEGGVPSHQEIHKDIKDHNPHLSKDEVKSAANVIHAHMSKHRLGEEVELDEARYPGFRPGLGLGKRGAPSQRDNYKDFNDGRPLGFTPIKDKDEPKSGMSDKLRQAKIKNPAMKSMAKEEVELDELDQKTLSNYATRTKFSSDPKRREGAAKAQEKLNKKSKDIQKEEAEQVDEALRHEIAGQVAAFLGNKIDPLHGQIMHVHGKEAYRQAATHIRRVAGEVHDAVSALHDRLHKQLRTGGLATEEVELDESHFKVGDKVKCKKSGMGGKITKIDKEDGGENEKYYTFKREDGKVMKKAPNELTKLREAKETGFEKTFRTQNNGETYNQYANRRAKEENERQEQMKKQRQEYIKQGIIKEEDDTMEKIEMASTQAHFIKYAAEEIIDYLEMDGKIEEWYQNKLSKVHSDMEGLHSWMEGHKRKEGMAEETEELDEISQNTALNAYAKRAERAASTKDPKDQEKADKSITRIGKRWTADAQRRAWNRADKLIYKEETELEEDGKLKGGAKDPCWKGYQMVGTKKKNGREVPNCVPREEKEYKTFKALKEELNGDSNRS